jgi:hypothetical protein
VCVCVRVLHGAIAGVWSVMRGIVPCVAAGPSACPQMLQYLRSTALADPLAFVSSIVAGGSNIPRRTIVAELPVKDSALFRALDHRLPLVEVQYVPRRGLLPCGNNSSIDVLGGSVGSAVAPTGGTKAAGRGMGTSAGADGTNVAQSREDLAATASALFPFPTTGPARGGAWVVALRAPSRHPLLVPEVPAFRPSHGPVSTHGPPPFFGTPNSMVASGAGGWGSRALPLAVPQVRCGTLADSVWKGGCLGARRGKEEGGR